MYVNVTEYSVSFKENGCIELRLNSAERVEREKNPYPTSFYLRHEELPMFLACMQGKADFLPYFDDLTCILKAGVDGFRHIHLGEGRYQEDHFDFPNKLLTDLHDLITQHITDPQGGHEWSLTTEQIAYYAEMVKPRVRWDYRHITNGKWEGPEWKEWVVKDVRESVNHWGARYPKLAEDVEALERIAANYSTFGNEIVILFQFDSWNHHEDNVPDSYYFCIMTPDNQRIMNGGLIAHRYEKNGEVSYEYSMHT